MCAITRAFVLRAVRILSSAKRNCLNRRAAQTERGRWVFLQSDRAADVLVALRSHAADAKFVHGSAKELLIEDGRCVGVRASDGKTTAQPMFWLYRRHQLPRHRQRWLRL